MEVDAFLCDSIAAAEQKLYVQGAGWNILFAATFPARHPRLGIGVLIHVPYTATNQLHHFELHIEDSDGGRLPLGDLPPGAAGDETKAYVIPADFNVGRPPILRAGDEQIVPLGMNLDGLTFDRPDSYNIVIEIDGTEVKRLAMRVQHLAQPGQVIQQ